MRDISSKKAMNHLCLKHRHNTWCVIYFCQGFIVANDNTIAAHEFLNKLRERCSGDNFYCICMPVLYTWNILSCVLEKIFIYRGVMKRLFPVVLLAAVLSCGQWKVTAYQSSKICSLKSGIRPGQVHIKVEDHGLLDLSFNIRLFGGKIYVTDNVLKRVQILDRDGKALVLIGQKVPVPSGDSLIQSPFNFSVLGHIVADSDGNLYVQNRIMSRSGGGGISEELDFSPSYVLKFDGEGKLQYTLGKTGPPNIPFDYIDSLEVDRKDRLVVVSRKFNTWTVSRFNGKNRDFTVNFVKSDFRDTEENRVNQGKIDNVRIMRDGDTFLLSVSYYSGLRFKYRRYIITQYRKIKLPVPS